jgi:hypothetical protein
MLGWLDDPELDAAAGEVLAGKLFTHGAHPAPRRLVVDATGCCGGALFQYVSIFAAKQHKKSVGLQRALF